MFINMINRRIAGDLYWFTNLLTALYAGGKVSTAECVNLESEQN